MDPVSTFLALAVAVAVVVVVVLLRVIGTRDGQLKELREEHESVRGERDEARQQSRDSRKAAEGLSSDLKQVRHDLKTSKKKAFKASKQVEQAEGKVSNVAGFTSAKQQRLKAVEKAHDEAKKTIASLEEQIAEARREGAKASDAEAARVRAPAITSGAGDGARVRELTDRLDRLQDRLERAQDALGDERSSARSRDRDLMTARKLAVQHERSFQVVRGQLDIIRERLTEEGISLTAEPEAMPDTDAPAPSDDAEPEAAEKESPASEETSAEASA